jgi:hypothetical protein
VTRRRMSVVGVAALALAFLLAPLAEAATDLYSNVGPGGSIGVQVDRYPLSSYVLDQHFDAVKASLTGGFSASGVPAMIAYFLANLLWQITAFVANAVIELFALAFSVDLLNGSPTTAGAGALAPVSDTIHNLYAHTLGEPWMEAAIVAAGCWAMLRALVQRRYAETASALGMSLVYCLIALAIVARPDATIGSASRWTNEISGAFLSVTSHGEVSSGAEARRAASDELFDALIFRPWVALNFGGTEHCIRLGTGSKDHDPESVPVRPLAPDARADAAARARLQRDGAITTATKQCVDNTTRYPEHFLRFAPGSDDRDAEYEAVNRADPTKVPDSDPGKGTYRPAIVDKPVTDAMEQGGQYQRLLLALVVMVGELGAVLLLGSLSVSVLLAQMVVLLLACFTPVALVAGIIPGRGHELFKNWSRHLATYLVRKAAYSLVLAVLLAALAALQDATSNLGWLLSFTMQSLFTWMVFLQREKLAGAITAAVSGQQPGRDAQLRRLLGVAYLARRAASPARRREHGDGLRPTDYPDQPGAGGVGDDGDGIPPAPSPGDVPGDGGGGRRSDPLGADYGGSAPTEATVGPAVLPEPPAGVASPARHRHDGARRRHGDAPDDGGAPAPPRTSSRRAHGNGSVAAHEATDTNGGTDAPRPAAGTTSRAESRHQDAEHRHPRNHDDRLAVGRAADLASSPEAEIPAPRTASSDAAPRSLAEELRGDRNRRQEREAGRPAAAPGRWRRGRGELGDQLDQLREVGELGDQLRPARDLGDQLDQLGQAGELGDQLRPARDLGDQLDRPGEIGELGDQLDRGDGTAR